MKSSKREKAIQQALASLSIDKIFVKEEHVNRFRIKNNIEINQGPTLILKRGINNVKR